MIFAVAVFVLSAIAASAGGLSTLQVQGLPRMHTARGQTQPVSLSWTLHSGDSVAESDALVAQTAYQLQVLDAVETVHLDYEQASSDAGVASLPGEAISALPASRPLSYRLRVQLNSTTWTTWSAPAQWRVGPGRSAVADWPAGSSWICTSPTGSADVRSSILRTEFSLPAGRTVVSALVHCTGLGQFRVLVNGVDVLGVDYYVPGQTDWRKRVLYSTYDIAPGTFVAGGANAIAGVIGNGMYNVPDSGRYSKWTGSFGPRMLLLALVVALDDGSNVTVTTSAAAGAAWAATDGGPIVLSHEYSGEDRNATLEVPGFDQPGFDAAVSNPLVAWTPAEDCTAAFPGGALAPSAFEPVGAVRPMPALNFTASQPPGTVLVDVGKNFAGFASVSVAAVPADHGVRVWPSETMYGGRIQQASGGTPVYWQHFPNASAAVPGGAPYNATLTPTFSTYGWRWLAVQVLPVAAMATVAASPEAATASAAAAARAASVSGAVAGEVGPNGTITVLQASYGTICDPGLSGDATAAVAAFCDGLDPCAYTVCVCGDNTCAAGAPPCLPDPARNCAKDFAATWRCTADAPGYNRSVYLPAEADNAVAALSCGPPPPPPVLPQVTAAGGTFVRAAAPTVGSWSSSNPWVNAIHAITLQAVEANAQSVLTDCPHRERLGWLEVSWLMAPSIAYNLDISRLWAKIALDTVDSQLPSGMVPDIAPEYTVFSGGFRDSPEWGSAAIQNPAFLHAWYGDAAILNATYAAGQRYIDYLLSQRNAAGLLAYGLGDWIPVVQSPAGVTGTGTLVQDLQAMAAAATALGRASEAANYTALAQAAASAYEAAFWDAGAKGYPTQCAAGYPLALGFATDPAAARAFLVRDVVTRGNVTTSGEIGNRYALLALAEAAGGPEAVWASLLRTDAPGYGWMLTMGETALAESWTDSQGDSHIHAMYGHIDEYLYAYVAGIRQQPGSTAWRRVLLAPRLPLAEGPGAWVRASFESPRGLIAVHAVLEGEASSGAAGAAAVTAVSLTLTCPVGAACEAWLPLTGATVAVPATGRPHAIRDVLPVAPVASLAASAGIT